MKSIAFLLTFIYCYIFPQKYETDDQIFFIGQKVNQIQESKLSTFAVVPANKKDFCDIVDDDGNCVPLLTLKGNWKESVESNTTYKIIKVIKGHYTEAMLSSILITYNSESPVFEIQEAKKSKFVLIGVIRRNDKWFQCFVEKVYPTNSNKWILPYKDTYPFLNYEKVFPQKLKNSERVKIRTDASFYKTKHYSTPEFVKPHYMKRKKYATALYGFVL